MVYMSKSTIPALSRAEWRAVAIALNDADHSAAVAPHRPGFLSRLWTALTGNEPRRPLADPRLDTLRSYVFAVRRHPRRAANYVPILIALGFNHAQLHAIALLSA